MKVGKIFSMIGKDISQAKLDLTSGWKVGGRLAKINSKTLPYNISYRTTSIFRNLNRSGNIIPAVTSGAFFLIPIPGAQPVGFLLGYGIKQAINSNIAPKISKSLKSTFSMLF